VLDTHKCGVHFHWLTPRNLVKYPFFLFLSTGIHTHPPPPPSCTPKKVMQDLTELVREMQYPGLTPGM
jgi:hypothetical protein